MTRFAAPVRHALQAAGLDPADVERVIATAVDEDLCRGPDVTTTATVPPDAVAEAAVVARASGTLAGLPVALAVLDHAGGSTLAARVERGDGQRVRPGDTVLRVTGPLRTLLTAERPMLNLLTHLSGIATLTRCWVEEVAGTGATVRDTRKTTPGLRALQKYAVRCGGGTNHRMALGDAALVKDNHVAAAGGIAAAVHAVRSHAPTIPLEVECDTVDHVRDAVAAGATLLLLDNMSLVQLRDAVAVARAVPGVHLEASGGLTLREARAVASTGVDYLAVGALTHSAPALDLGLDLVPI